MPLVCFSLQHDRAPLGAIGLMSPGADERGVLVRRWLAAEPRVSEALVVVTCNRVEWWSVAESVCPARHALQRVLAAWGGREVALDGASGWRTLEDNDAIEHLLRVACGLEAVVRGEGEILGQVRRAHEEALAAGTVGDELHALFRRVVRTARSLRHRELANASGRTRSAARVAVARAREIFAGRTDSPRVLIVGAGAVAADVAGAVAEWSAATTTVLNRTVERAEALAALHGMAGGGLDQLGAALGTADVVFATTFHPAEVLGREVVEAALQARRWPLLFVDLSASEAVHLEDLKGDGRLALVTLRDLGQQAVAETPDERQRVARFEAAVAEALPELLRWQRSLEADRVANEVRRRLDDIRRDHLGRYAAGGELPPRADAMSQSLLNAVLHEVTAAIRALDPADPDDARALATVQRLFNLHVPASASPPDRDS